MNLKIVVAFALVAVASQIDAACLCHFPEGRDMCQSSCKSGGPLVVRPATLPKLNFDDFCKPRIICKQVGGLQKMQSTGDLCSCRQSIVIPALVPRPKCPCKTCNTEQVYNSGSSCCNKGRSSSNVYTSGSTGYSDLSRYSENNAGSNNAHHAYVQTSGDGYSSSDFAPVDKMYTAAADPVSLSLAYKMQNQNCASHEDKLNFGFRKMPTDGSRQTVAKAQIPEENLYQLNGEIVELRPCSCTCKGTMNIDEEALEELAATEFSDSEFEDCNGSGSGCVKKLSYGEIGFTPAKITEVPFVAVSGCEQANPVLITDEVVSTCNDGFVPGNVIIKNIPKKEIYTQSVCCPSDNGDDVVPIRYVSSYSSSSDSSNDRQQCSQHYSCGCN